VLKLGKTIVTSALPYIYSTPHLGNFVGSVLPADVYANYLRLKGEDVIFICGSDVHGAAIEIQAIKDRTTPKDLAKKMHEDIKALFESYGCNFTYYGSTDSEQNKIETYSIFEALNRNGYIGRVEKQLPYCNHDKMFLADRFIEGKCPVCGYESARGDQCDKCSSLLEPSQLIGPHCTICGKKEITFKKTDNVTIKLDKLQEKLQKFVTAGSKNWSKNAVNEAEKYLKEGLRERDISRHTKWGFPIPLKGFEDQVFYVWFDAPIGYIGITREWDARKAQEYWYGKDTRLIQFMGKDNIIFHTILFPGALLGANLGHVLANTVKAYEFLNWEGKKFSKSRGIGMDLKDALGVVSNPDYWRFSLIFNAPESADSDFTTEGFVEAVNKIMNGKIGNLFQRVFTLIKANEDIFDPSMQPDQGTMDKLSALYNEYLAHFNNIELREALKALVAIADLGNAIMSEKEPWKMAKSAKADKAAAKEFSSIMVALEKISYHTAILLYPFTPSSSIKALEYFGLDRAPSLKDTSKVPMLNLKKEIKPLFEKLETSQIKKIGSYS